MTLNSLIESGLVDLAQRIFLYGPNGCGKTYLVHLVPHVLFLDLEKGTVHLKNAKRVRISTLADLFPVIRSLGADAHEYRTVAIDSITKVEEFLHQRVCQNNGWKSIEQPGWGKGFNVLKEEFAAFLQLLEDHLIANGINVVIIGHSKVQRVELPGLSDSYDRFEPNLHKYNSAQLKEWADAVLHMDWEVHLAETSSGKMRGVGGKNRIIHAMHSAAYDAKNRVGLPDTIEATYEAIAPLFPPVRNPVSELLRELSDLDQARVHGFLVSRGEQSKVSADGDIADVAPEYARRALKGLPKFRKAIEEFQPGAAPNGVDEPVTKQMDAAGADESATS